MTRRRRAPAALAAVVSGYLLLAGWGVGVMAGPGTHRSVSVLCSSIDELCREWAEGFTSETGIEVAVVRVSTGEALTRLSRPGGTREFDVWHGGPADSYVIAADRGLLAPYVSPEAGAIPAAYKDPDGYWTGVYLGVLGFCSNPAMLERLGVPVPRSWDDLLDPRLTGNVSVPSPLTSGTGYTVAWTQLHRLGSTEAALEYLTVLDARVLQYTRSGLAPARIAARGEAAVGVTFSQHCVQARADTLTDLRITYPEEGTGVEIGSVALVAGSEDSDGARRYVDYALSRAAQRAGAQANAAQLPTRADLPAGPELGAEARLLEYTPQQAATGREHLVAEVVSVVPR